MRAFISAFKAFYQTFQSDRLSDLDKFYTDQSVFVDPIGRIEGVEGIRTYFAHTMKGLSHCEFEFLSESFDEHANRVSLEWVMSYAHPRLNKGQMLKLHGCTLLVLTKDDSTGFTVGEHRDYYDLGEMLYEHIPLVGCIVRRVRQNLSLH